MKVSNLWVFALSLSSSNLCMTENQPRRHLGEVSNLDSYHDYLQLSSIPDDLYDQASSWGSLKPGRGVFLKERCPVSSCVLASNRWTLSNLVILKINNYRQHYHALVEQWAINGNATEWLAQDQYYSSGSVWIFWAQSGCEETLSLFFSSFQNNFSFRVARVIFQLCKLSSSVRLSSESLFVFQSLA